MKGLAAGALAAVVLLTLAVLDPSTSSVFPPCLFRALTGWQCPGCGSARALHALLHGEIAAALGANPLTVAAVPLVIVEMARHALEARPSLLSSLGSRTILAIAAGLILYGVARNL
jgi:hypothetical protein